MLKECCCWWLFRSMSIYQFLIAVRSEGQQLMSESGETTSHIMGMFYRTLRMVDNGIKYCGIPFFFP
jgi:flap endonuclease-1